MNHGLNCYVNHHCRCSECRAAMTVYRRGLRAYHKGKPPPGGHGTANAYDNYGCRCGECRAGKASRDRGRPR